MSRDPLGLTRGLLNQTAALRHGFLDLLGDSTDPPVPTVAQRAMNSPFFATMYERLWRPTSFYLASGVTARVEQRRAAAALRLSSAENLLDVACGPGNFTGPLAGELPDGSLAVGFEISAPMLTRAVQDNSGTRVCYVRGDAHTCHSTMKHSTGEMQARFDPPGGVPPHDHPGCHRQSRVSLITFTDAAGDCYISDLGNRESWGDEHATADSGTGERVHFRRSFLWRRHIVRAPTGRRRGPRRAAT